MSSSVSVSENNADENDNMSVNDEGFNSHRTKIMLYKGDTVRTKINNEETVVEDSLPVNTSERKDVSHVYRKLFDC